jgi:two-component system CheB/CheR fusion protein
LKRLGRKKTRKTGAGHSTGSTPPPGKFRAAKQHKSGGEPRPGPTLFVGIGASAGGLEAFKTFFANMPPDSGMAFVLVQHLAPDHKSLLADLIGRTTAMGVMEAEDETPVAANCVYVIPPDATLTIKDAALRVTKPAPAREHRRPIDAFFSSLAEDQGENAVCIVLSGTGSDGAVGLTAIKEFGGLTLAQAGFDHVAMSGMPHNAAATGLVDHVSQVEDMPNKLIEYQRHLSHVASRKEADGTRGDAATHLTAISTLLRTKLGHDFSQYKEKTLVRRIQRRMQVLQIDTVPRYIAHLREEQGEIELLFRELLIGVTQFFRDPDAFETLRTTVIPKLLENKHADDALRIWIPACAAGQEVYSIAILVKEEIERQGATLHVQIFGTDIDDNAVAFARAARYRKPMAGLSPEQIGRWFAEEGDEYCPIKAIREMCVFSTHSVIKDPPFSKLDLVSCRNLLIYLDADLQDRVIRTFHYALRPGGALFLGSSESVTRSAKLFTPLDKKQRIFQRLDAETVLPALPARAPATRTLAHPAARTSPSGDERLDKYARRTLEKYSPVYVMIDQRHEIVCFSGGEIGLYLGFSAGAASLNLFDILRKPLRPVVRAAVQAASSAKEPVVHNDVVLRVDGKSRTVTIIVAPVIEPGAEAGLSVVAFQDTGLLSARKDGTSGENNTDANARSLEQELRTTRAQLQAAIDEYEIVNEEMKSANEEYQSVNEELQSSNEELETSKEEMQSVNEELQTINAEMTSKNDQLTRLNSDLRNLFESTEIATIFLDNELRIKSFTPGMTDIFHLRDADRGRPITDIVTLLSYVELQRDVKAVLRKLTSIEREVQATESGATFIMRIRPYRSVNNVIEGVVITFVDITERRKADDARRDSEARFQTIADNIPILCWMANAEGWIYWYNRRWYEYTGITPETQEGWGWESVHDPQVLPIVVERWKNSLTTGQPFEMVFPLKGADGMFRPFLTRIVPLRNKQGEVVNWFGSNTDITNERRVEEARVKLAAIVESSHDAILSEDLDGVILSWNSGAERLFGYTNQEAIGQRIFMLMSPERLDEERDILNRIRRGERIEHYETIRRHKDGKLLDVSLVVSPVLDGQDNVIGASKIARNIAERKEAEKRAALLMGELDHRVKNILAIVQSVIMQTLKSSTSPGAFAASMEGRIAAIARAHSLLTDRGGKTEVSLRALIETELKPYVHGANVDIDGVAVALRPRLGLAMAMAIHELASNAAKYGALSTASGRLAATWQISGNGENAALNLVWQETGGPAVAQPSRHGFGTTLLERTLQHEFDATVHREFLPSGLRCAIDIPFTSESGHILPKGEGEAR